MRCQQNIKFVMNCFTYCCVRDYSMCMFPDGDPTGSETCRSFNAVYLCEIKFCFWFFFFFFFFFLLFIFDFVY